VLWGEAADAPRANFATGLFEPAVGINRGGWVAAATLDVVQIYGTHYSRLTFVGKVEGPKGKPIAVLTTDDAERFAVVTEAGWVYLYEITN
jgi:hypothetical protein